MDILSIFKKASDLSLFRSPDTKLEDVLKEAVSEYKVELAKLLIIRDERRSLEREFIKRDDEIYKEKETKLESEYKRLKKKWFTDSINFSFTKDQQLLDLVYKLKKDRRNELDQKLPKSININDQISNLRTESMWGSIHIILRVSPICAWCYRDIPTNIAELITLKNFESFICCAFSGLGKPPVLLCKSCTSIYLKHLDNSDHTFLPEPRTK